MHEIKVNQNKLVIYSKENMRLQRSQYIGAHYIKDEDQKLDENYIEPLELRYCLPHDASGCLRMPHDASGCQQEDVEVP